jgi:hypothetical protein
MEDPKVTTLCGSIQSHGSWRLDDSWGVPPWRLETSVSINLRIPWWLLFRIVSARCSIRTTTHFPVAIHISYRSYTSLRVIGARHGGSWGHKVMPHGPVEKCDLQKALEPFARWAEKRRTMAPIRGRFVGDINGDLTVRRRRVVMTYNQVG